MYNCYFPKNVVGYQCSTLSLQCRDIIQTYKHKWERSQKVKVSQNKFLSNSTALRDVVWPFLSLLEFKLLHNNVYNFLTAFPKFRAYVYE